MLVLAAASVELPLFIAFLLVRRGPHFGPEWRFWPILAGLFPCFFASRFQVLPHLLSILELRIAEAAFTAGLIGLVFFLGSRTKFWRQFLVGAFGISSALAVLGFLLLAA
jgi:hypothetical protein